MKKNKIVNYIIGGWLSGRRAEVMGGLDLANLQFKQLTELKHNLNKIYYVVPLIGFNEVIYSVVDKYPSLKIEVLTTEDNRFSHGSWDYCLQKTCDEADFTIMTEDDYLPVIDNIDSVFLDYFDNDQVGYVCQQQIELPIDSPRYGALLENGMVRNKAFKKGHGFKIVSGSYYGASLTQTCFLENIVKSGYIIKDTLDKYSVFYNRSGRVSFYGDPDHPDIFRPVECLLYDCKKYIEMGKNKVMDETPYIQEGTPLNL